MKFSHSYDIKTKCFTSTAFKPATDKQKFATDKNSSNKYRKLRGKILTDKQKYKLPNYHPTVGTNPERERHGTGLPLFLSLIEGAFSADFLPLTVYCGSYLLEEDLVNIFYRFCTFDVIDYLRLGHYSTILFYDTYRMKDLLVSEQESKKIEKHQ